MNKCIDHRLHLSEDRDRDSRRMVSLSMANVEEKTAQQNPNHRWDCLPSVVMDEIFSHLDDEEWINASAVCWSWREAFFHPRFWTQITFTLSDPEKISSANKLAERFRCSVEYVTVECHTPCSGSELHRLLQYFRENHNLRELCIEPTPAIVTDRSTINFQPWIDPILDSIQQIIQSSRQLLFLSLGFIEELVVSADSLVKMLAQRHGRHLTYLELASVKRSHQTCQQAKQRRFRFEQFESIVYLSMDYEDLNDAVLESLTSGTLKRLVVHVHETSKDHPGTSNEAWKAFKEKNKRCRLHLIFVRAYTTINVAQETILKPEMPLSQLKALFCESENWPLLHRIGTWYQQTIKSVIWIDSTNGCKLRPHTDAPNDTYEHFTVSDFICHQCPKFKELVYFGQVYSSDPTPLLFIRPVSRCAILPGAFQASERQSDGTYELSHFRTVILKHSECSLTCSAMKELNKIVYDALNDNSEKLMLSLLLRGTRSGNLGVSRCPDH